MYFLFSGEGATDLGVSSGNSIVSEGSEYQYGPLTIFVDQIVEECCRFSLLESQHYGFISKQTLKQRADELKANKKSPHLPGKKRGNETAYFFKNARIFARIAMDRQTQLNDIVIGILFRDSDGTASAGRGSWEDKRRSMESGFMAEGFQRGVPMIPKPKSEAWLICALQANPYQSCAVLESRSGNDNSPNSLKQELQRILGEPVTRDLLSRLVIDRRIDVRRIEMPSLKSFLRRLKEVI